MFPKYQHTLNKSVSIPVVPVATAVLFITLLMLVSSVFASPNVLKVGPQQTFIFPSIAAEFAKDGDIIEIDASGIYDQDTAKWTKNNLTIRGVGGRAKIPSKGLIKNGKAIWVVSGNNITIENVEFSGARVSDKNGAGIRHEGSGLIVRNCLFEDNENGILTSHVDDSEVVVEHSEFRNNGSGDGKTHNMYIGKIKSFTLKSSYTHHAIVGHNVKSRARNNYILYNRIMDEELGRSSYAIDLPNGGKAVVMGNVIQQGEQTENSNIISYGMEGIRKTGNAFYLLYNTIVNDRSAGLFLKVAEGARANVVNNIFAGRGELVKGSAIMLDNLLPDKDARFISRKTYDYHLEKNSPAVNRAVTVPQEWGTGLTPESEYVHPARLRPRPKAGKLDMGAFEFAK